MSDVAERFWAKVDKNGPTPPHLPGLGACWAWRASVNRKGYGEFSRGARIAKAHRVSWELAHGPIPEGMFVCHHCDNPSCVNPAHLFLGTNRDNAIDMTAKGRNGAHTRPECRPRGERHGRRKVTTPDVIAIRAARLAGEPLKSLADRYGLHLGTISAIATRVTWRHVP